MCVGVEVIVAFATRTLFASGLTLEGILFEGVPVQAEKNFFDGGETQTLFAD